MKNQRGFTLVELLVVVTIIGILIAIAVPNYQKAKNKARDAQVQAGIAHIAQALENYSMNHDGLYPGVALPIVDEDLVNPYFHHNDPNGEGNGDGTGNGQMFSMRGIIGGGIVRPDDQTLWFLRPWYFQPKTDGTAPPQLPDRLMADGSLDAYPNNPFKQNIQGVSNAGIPMLNIFGIETRFAPSGEVVGFWPQDLNLGYPNVYTQTGAGGYSFPFRMDDAFFGEAGFRIDQTVPQNSMNLRWDRDGDNRVTASDLKTLYAFPSGDFAYIPLDPIQTDPQANDYMRYCKNYWLIAYGSTDAARANRYANVIPNLPRPLGDGKPGLANMTEYEKMVRRALCGAMFVTGTAYKDQIRVADQS